MLLARSGSAHAHGSPGCCFASAFVPLPDENQDGDRSSLMKEPIPFR